MLLLCHVQIFYYDDVCQTLLQKIPVLVDFQSCRPREEHHREADGPLGGAGSAGAGASELVRLRSRLSEGREGYEHVQQSIKALYARKTQVGELHHPLA